MFINRPLNIPKSDVSFSCGEDNFDIASGCKYLGIWLQEHHDINNTTKEIAKSTGRALGAIISQFKAIGGMPFDVSV